MDGLTVSIFLKNQYARPSWEVRVVLQTLSSSKAGHYATGRQIVGGKFIISVIGNTNFTFCRKSFHSLKCLTHATAYHINRSESIIPFLCQRIGLPLLFTPKTIAADRILI